MGIAAAVYGAGAALLLLRLIAGLLQLSRIRRTGRAIRPQPAGGGDVLESPLVVTPVTVGVLAPRIVLPLQWSRWPADMLAAVLAHERTHAARRDPLISVMARLNCALFWYARALIIEDEPGYARQVREKLDESTDAAVLLATGRSLLSSPSGNQTSFDRAALGMHYVERASQLDSRVAQEAQEFLRTLDRSQSLAAPFAAAPRDSWPALLAESQGGERLRHLAVLAELEYMSAESLDHRARQREGSADRSPDADRDAAEAAAGFARSTDYAQIPCSRTGWSITS